MDLPLTMNAQQMRETELAVESYNKSLQKSGRTVDGSLGKDQFLRLLVVQLENQDPTNPLDDKEFISQMAQFSSLEQMTEMNRALTAMITDSRVDTSRELLGKHVEVFDRATGEKRSGLVEEVSFAGETPMISVDGLSYSVDDVIKVSINK